MDGRGHGHGHGRGRGHTRHGMLSHPSDMSVSVPFWYQVIIPTYNRPYSRLLRTICLCNVCTLVGFERQRTLVLLLVAYRENHASVSSKPWRRGSFSHLHLLALPPLSGSDHYDISTFTAITAASPFPPRRHDPGPSSGPTALRAPLAPTRPYISSDARVLYQTDLPLSNFVCPVFAYLSFVF